MEADILRLVLIVVGVVAIAGMYFWDLRQKQRKREETARRRVELETPLPDGEEVVVLKKGRRDPLTDEPMEEVGDDISERIVADDRRRPVADDAADDTDSMPDKILQISVVAAGEGAFDAAEIHRAARAVGLEYGAMKIFHRRAVGDVSSRVIFSMASMVEPGTIPADITADFQTPGLTLFIAVPGEDDDIAMFSDMVVTAQRLAQTLEAELRDAHRSPLTDQVIQHMHDEILEYGRQKRLERMRG